MHAVVLGATGNVGTSLLEALAREPAVDPVLGVARRLPAAEFETRPSHDRRPRRVRTGRGRVCGTRDGCVEVVLRP